MPVTKNYEFPLYDPEDSPDLTPTGREAAAVIAIDDALKTEETERIEGDAGLNAALEKETAERKAADKELTDSLANEVADRKAADTTLGGRIDAEAAARESADTALGWRIDTERADREAITGDIVKQLTKEKADRESADTALGGRIDNAETEISANSADLTGIKGLTYGDNHVAFLENSNGEYDSPALQEIEEQIAAGKLNVAIYGVTNFKEAQAMLPNVLCIKGSLYAYVCFSSNNQINFFTEPTTPTLEIYTLSVDNRWVTSYASVDWDYVSNKPFKTVGNGLNTDSKSLSLDTTYLPTVSAGSGVTVTPTTDGNHTKYEIASTGGASTGGTNVSVSTGTGTAYTGLTVTPTADGDTTRYDIDLNAASKTARGGVTVGSGLNVNAAGFVSVDTAALPILSPSAGILIDTSTSGGRVIYTVQASVDEKTIGYNDDDQLTVLSTSTGGITGDTTWSELES